MNIFKNMLFLQGYLIDPREADDADGDRFARGYGNQVASTQAFPPLGHSRNPLPPLGADLYPTGACG